MHCTHCMGFLLCKLSADQGADGAVLQDRQKDWIAGSLDVAEVMRAHNSRSRGIF